MIYGLRFMVSGTPWSDGMSVARICNTCSCICTLSSPRCRGFDRGFKRNNKGLGLRV